MHAHGTPATTAICFCDGCQVLYLAAADPLPYQTAAHGLRAGNTFYVVYSVPKDEASAEYKRPLCGRGSLLWLFCKFTDQELPMLSATVPCACTDPILAYSAGAEVNQLQWSNTQPDWVAICFSNKTQILRV